jgi:hypothetical protein
MSVLVGWPTVHQQPNGQSVRRGVHSQMGTLSAYVRALGGVLRVTADFGDEVLILDGPQFGDDRAEPRAPRRGRAS